MGFRDEEPATGTSSSWDKPGAFLLRLLATRPSSHRSSAGTQTLHLGTKTHTFASCHKAVLRWAGGSCRLFSGPARWGPLAVHLHSKRGRQRALALADRNGGRRPAGSAWHGFVQCETATPPSGGVAGYCNTSRTSIQPPRWTLMEMHPAGGLISNFDHPFRCYPPDLSPSVPVGGCSGKGTSLGSVIMARRS